MTNEIRIDQIVNHLTGTKLQLSSVLTTRERDCVITMRKIMDRVEVHPETLKWIKKDVAA